MLLFAITGITLNHAGQIESSPVVTMQTAQLPPALQRSLQGDHVKDAPIPDDLSQFTTQTLGVSLVGKRGEWSEGELYVALPKPGGDAWLSVDTASGKVEYENTNRGWVSYLNDLHKGRNTGAAWTWFIDAFAVVCLVFCISGLLLLQYHSKNRAATWPIVGLGLLLPFLIVVLLIH
jgi:hypothetical protein